MRLSPPRGIKMLLAARRLESSHLSRLRGAAGAGVTFQISIRMSEDVPEPDDTNAQDTEGMITYDRAFQRLLRDSQNQYPTVFQRGEQSTIHRQDADHKPGT
jgi:hypothetical protein